jgi:hypothetical protein
MEGAIQGMLIGVTLPPPTPCYSTYILSQQFHPAGRDHDRVLNIAEAVVYVRQIFESTA